MKNKNDVSQGIYQIASKSGRLTTLVLVALSLIMIGLLYNSKQKLEDAGGVFEIPTVEHADGRRTIETALMIDVDHHFDDRVALVQNYSARYLASLLNTTTSQYEQLDIVAQEIMTPDGLADYRANIKKWRIDKAFSNKETPKRMHVRFSDGVPLVRNQEFLTELSDEEKLDRSILNQATITKWTIKANFLLTVGTYTSPPEISRTLTVSIDLLPIDGRYRHDSFKISRMSLWAPIK